MATVIERMGLIVLEILEHSPVLTKPIAIMGEELSHFRVVIRLGTFRTVVNFRRSRSVI
jgi:hypothetical protein